MKRTKEQTAPADAQETTAPAEAKAAKPAAQAEANITAPAEAKPAGAKPAKPASVQQAVELDPRQPLCILNGNRLVYSGTGVRRITFNAPPKGGREVEK